MSIICGELHEDDGPFPQDLTLRHGSGSSEARWTASRSLFRNRAEEVAFGLKPVRFSWDWARQYLCTLIVVAASFVIPVLSFAQEATSYSGEGSAVAHTMPQTQIATGSDGQKTTVRAATQLAQTAAGTADQKSNAGAEIQQAQGSVFVPPPGLAATHEAELEKFRHFDELGEPNLTTSAHLPTALTLFGDLGGWRSYLAEHDIAVQGEIAAPFAYQFNSTGQPRSPQLYNGQRFTMQGGAIGLFATVGLGRLGLPNSKLVFGIEAYGTTFHGPNGPSTVNISRLSYYQSFFDKQVELNVGLLANYFQYVGLFAGGAPYLGGGLSSLIPIEVGLSADPDPAPGANLTYHFTQDGYVKVGVQRSNSPKGLGFETMDNGFGLRLHYDGARALYIGEVGIKREATANQHQLWLRGGYIYNTSDFINFATGGTSQNHAAYLAGDYQLLQLSQALPFRGVYIGATADTASDNVNAITRNYEARLYSTGLFASRPTDSIVLKVDYTKFGDAAQRALSAQGLYTNSYQMAYNASYSYHLLRSVFVVPAISFVQHPSLVGNFKNAWIGSITLYIGL